MKFESELNNFLEDAHTKNLKRELSTSVSYVSNNLKRLAVSHDGHPLPHTAAAAAATNTEISSIEKKQTDESIAETKTEHSVESETKPTTTMTNTLKISNPILNDGGVLSVLSNSSDDFGSRYEILREVGKGGFSTVYQCRNRSTSQDYAVKVIDLRPLRLRERFNPARLRREVDIMRKLKHKNIIEFFEVYEDTDSLMMVMEYCPGYELFDVILARKFFTEKDAKPVFKQIAEALYYLHSLNIIHRDVKPENVLIASSPDPQTGELVAKLLDFGLSKNAGAGSAAKTFVGTPCYVAPEVEYTSKGLGGTYSFPADCWSLGAVLYVMLVARFPEFEQDQISGKIVVKLSPALWDNISAEAKDLIRGLMNTNPNARLTAASALMHPWLGEFRMTQEQLSVTANTNYELNQQIQREESEMDTETQRTDGMVPPSQQLDVHITSSGQAVHHQAMVVRAPIIPPHHVNSMQNMGEVMGTQAEQQIQLAPLLYLQRSIAGCFEEMHNSYLDSPEIASEIHRGAMLCREQLSQSTKMLRKVEHTASSVLSMFMDLELAIEEGEPQLAVSLFNTAKSWISDLRVLVTETQSINKASMSQVQQIVEKTSRGIEEKRRQRASANRSNQINVSRQLVDAVLSKIGAIQNRSQPMIADGQTRAASNAGSSSEGVVTLPDNINLDVDQILELFMALFNNPSSSISARNNQNQGSSYETSKSGQQMERIYSIDTDSSQNSAAGSPELQRPAAQGLYGSGGEAILSAEKDVSGNGVIGSAAVKVASAAMRMDVQDERVSGSEGIALNSNSDEERIATKNLSKSSEAELLRKRTTTPPLHPRDGSTAAPMAVKATPSHTQLHTDRNDSRDSTISLDVANNQLIVVNSAPAAASNPPPPPNNATITNGDIQPPSPGGAHHLDDALRKLRQVDIILEQLSVFWANTEVVLDLLTQKGQHVEQFIAFSSKPRLMARFKERMEEYKRFWEGIQSTCANYIAGVNQNADFSESKQQMYAFLEKVETSSISTNSCK